VRASGPTAMAAVRLLSAGTRARHRWHQLSWSSATAPALTPLPLPIGSDNAYPLPWSDGAQGGFQIHEVPVEQDGLASFAYSSHVLPGERHLGILVEQDSGLSFQVVPCRTSDP